MFSSFYAVFIVFQYFCDLSTVYYEAIREVYEYEMEVCNWLEAKRNKWRALTLERKEIKLMIIVEPYQLRVPRYLQRGKKINGKWEREIMRVESKS